MRAERERAIRRSQHIEDMDDRRAREEEERDEDLDMSNMKAFVTTPLSFRRNRAVECYIERKRKGMMKNWKPEYHLYLSANHKHMLSSKKISGVSTAYYAISTSKTDVHNGSKGTHFMGKVRANFIGTSFYVYDDGLNPSKASSSHDTRRELAYATYAPNVMGTKGPRKMKIVVPAVDPDTNEAVLFKPMQKSESMSTRIEGMSKNCIYLVNKRPKWSESVGAYVLNFHGRVTMASVKNFQLVRHDDEDEVVVLQFGRIGKNKFTMDFRWPLTALQAFAICMSSFDAKLACE